MKIFIQNARMFVEGLPDVSYPNLFVPRRFVTQESLTLAVKSITLIKLFLTLTLTRNSSTNI